MKKFISEAGFLHPVLFSADTHSLSGRWWLLFLLGFTLAFSGCKETECEPDKPQLICPPDGWCNTMVTVQGIGCGNGIWGSRWLQTENGDYLQPWSTDIALPATVQPGDKFMIGYLPATRDNSHTEPACLAVPPKALPIRITCLEPVAPQGCSTYVTVEANSCYAGYWGEFWLVTDHGDYLMPWEGVLPGQTLQHGQRLKIGFGPATSTKPYQDKCQYVQQPPVARNINVTCVEPAAPVNSRCTVTVTAEDVICGAGVWANRWLRLDNGTYLQPWETALTGLKLEAGKRYTIGYELMPRDNRYNQVVICAAVPPNADAARITCLEEIPANGPH